MTKPEMYRSIQQYLKHVPDVPIPPGCCSLFEAVRFIQRQLSDFVTEAAEKEQTVDIDLPLKTYAASLVVCHKRVDRATVRCTEQAVNLQAANAKIAELERGIEKVREWCAAHKHYFEVSPEAQVTLDDRFYKTKVPTTAHQL